MNLNEKIYYACLVDTLQKHPLLKEVANVLAAPKEATNYDTVLQKAAHIAVGIEQYNTNDKYLTSIFDGLDIKKELQPEGYQYNLDTLALDNQFFPTKETPQYKRDNLVKNLKNDLIKVKESAENIFHLLEKYTVNVPSGFGKTVSFYDYLKIKTAAAICLGQEHEAEKEFLLIGASVSGIQSFLFDIISKKASVNLKGRSLYLQLLPELVIARILQDLNLFAPNVLYASGGNAYILAPHTKENITLLESIKKQVSNALFEAHGIGLYLEMAWEVTTSDELATNTKEAMRRLSIDKLAAQKRHKFSQQIINKDNFFEPKDEGSEQLRDAVTGEALQETDTLFDLNTNLPTKYQKAKEDTDSQPIAELTKYLMNQGEYLEDYKYLVIQPTTQSYEPFKNIGFSYQITKNTEGVKGKVYNIQSLNYLPNVLKPKQTYAFSFYGGNDFPKILIKNKDKLVAKTYSELAGQNDEERGRAYLNEFKEPTFKRLAVLRMDVDGLGSVFIAGFPSLTSYAVLSRSLDYFFKGYLNTIWETGTFEAFEKTSQKMELRFKEYIQIVYAGGDDIFVVGRWDAAIAFGKEVREQFKKWVCYNPKLGISAGISLVTPKFPVIKAADYADSAEKQAKNYEFNGQPKNAISMMGVTMNWDGEFKIVEDLKNKIVDLTDKNKYSKPLPQSFISNVNSFYETVAYNKTKELEEYSWIWQMAYSFTRMKERCKPNREDKTEVVDFLQVFINWTILRKVPPSVLALIQVETIDYFTFFKLLNLACVWASYELRDKKEFR